MSSQIKRQPSSLRISILPPVVEALESSDGQNPLQRRRASSFSSQSPTVVAFAESANTATLSTSSEEDRKSNKNVKRRATEPSLRKRAMKAAAKITFAQTMCLYEHQHLLIENFRRLPTAPPSTSDQPEDSLTSALSKNPDGEQKLLIAKSRKRRNSQPYKRSSRQPLPKGVVGSSTKSDATTATTSVYVKAVRGDEQGTSDTGSSVANRVDDRESPDAREIVECVRSPQELDSPVCADLRRMTCSLPLTHAPLEHSPVRTRSPSLRIPFRTTPSRMSNRLKCQSLHRWKSSQG